MVFFKRKTLEKELKTPKKVIKTLEYKCKRLNNKTKRQRHEITPAMKQKIIQYQQEHHDIK